MLRKLQAAGIEEGWRRMLRECPDTEKKSLSKLSQGPAQVCRQEITGLGTHCQALASLLLLRFG